MRPVLESLPAPAYAAFVTLAILAAAWVRRQEVRRLGYDRTPGHAIVGFAALFGGLFGAKLGMVLFVPPSEILALGWAALGGDFTGKTVVGGIAGGYLGVELAKKLTGVRHSTGDAFAVSLPLAQGIGRIGCFFHGCCVGIPSDSGLAVRMADVSMAGASIVGGARLPTALFECALDLGLAAGLWTIRARPRPPGALFKGALIGYATIRFCLEPLRGDTGWRLGPLTAVQWVCLAAIVGFTAALLRTRSAVKSAPEGALPPP